MLADYLVRRLASARSEVLVAGRHLLFISLALAGGVTTAASGDTARSAALDERLRGAEKVLVAVVRRADPRWEQNAFGDRLIVSRIRLDVQEVLKGSSTPVEWLQVEGGTLDGLTLHSSASPVLRPGDRALFFVTEDGSGLHRQYREGEGVLLLDRNNRVRGADIGLHEIRSRTRLLQQEAQ